MNLKQREELYLTKRSLKETLRETFQGSNNNPAFVNSIKVVNDDLYLQTQ